MLAIVMVEEPLEGVNALPDAKFIEPPWQISPIAAKVGALLIEMLVISLLITLDGLLAITRTL